MAESTPSTMACPNCGKAFRWKAQAAGRKVRCGCSQVFRVPQRAADKPEAVGPPAVTATSNLDQYELDQQEPADALSRGPGGARASSVGGEPPRKCPSCNRPLKPGVVICLNCGFHLAEGRKIETAVHQPMDDDEAGPVSPQSRARGGSDTGAKGDGGRADSADGVGGGANIVASTLAGQTIERNERDAEMAGDLAAQQHFTDWTLPLILIGVGLGLTALVDVGMPLVIPGPDWDLQRGLVYLTRAGARLIVQLPTVLLGVFLIAKLFGTSFGSLGTATLKLLAITIVTGLTFDAAALGIYLITGGLSVLGMVPMMALIVSLLAFWALCARLFEMEVVEVIALFGILMVGPIILLLFVIAPIIAAFLG